jgi:putative colanic acid biosynthesis UDP-glucose lipid carrier transferase
MGPTQRRIHQTTSLVTILQRLLDALGILVGLGWACTLATAAEGMPKTLSAASAIIIFYLLAEFTGMYRNWRGASAERELLCALGTWTITLPLVVILRWIRDWFGEPTPQFVPRTLLAWFVLSAILLLGARLACRAAHRLLRAKGFNTRRFAIAGVNDLGFQLARNIEESPHLGLKLAGFFDDRPPHRIPNVPPEIGERVGTISQLVEQARSGQIEMIYITFPMRAEERIRRLLAQLSDTTTSVQIVPDFFVFELLHSRWTDIGGLPVVSVFEHPFYGADGLLKRSTDIVLATLLLMLLAMPMSAVALAVKVTSPGPVFFRQRRYGMDGREIKVWKFRSMRVCDDGPLVRQATQNDPRLTPIGGFLRKTSIDELPQLFNVLCGTMSLVGPRPHATAHNEEYRRRIQGYMLRHKVKPGITGLAQVNGWRGETDTLYKMEKRIEYDHQYIREWSLWNDFKILAQTVFTVLRRDNAY